MSLNIERFVAGLHEYIERALAPLIARVAALEKQQKALRYRGTFQKAEIYERDNLITHDGSLWIALKDDPGKPGDSDGWQLVAKGRDGR